MPTDPKQRPDALLQEYVRKRRKQAEPPFRMSDSTRHLLHAEVARSKQARPVEVPEWYKLVLAWKWPLAWAGTAAVFLLAGGLLWHQLSSNELASANSPVGNLALLQDTRVPDAQAPVPAQEGTLNKRVEQFKLEPSEPKVQVALAPVKDEEIASNAARYGMRLPAAPQPASSPAAPVSSAGRAASSASPALRQALESTPLLAGPKATPARGYDSAPPQVPTAPARQLALNAPAPGADRLNESPAIPAPESRTLTAAKSTAVAEGLASPQDQAIDPAAQAANNNRLQFQQVNPTVKYRRNLNSPPLARVLPRFNLQRNGQHVQIEDADGSVYQGVSQTVGSQSQEEKLVRALAESEQASTDQAFSFRAAGTNRSLNQLVVFTGDFRPAPGQAVVDTAGAALATATTQQRPFNAPGAMGGQAGAAPGQARNVSSQAAATNGQGWINGTVSVGRSEFKIEAQQIGP